MYYWNILQMNESELVKRVFNVQKLSCCKNDWVLQIIDDLKLCNLTDSKNDIKKMKKYSFKRKIREASEKCADILARTLLGMRR